MTFKHYVEQHQSFLLGHSEAEDYMKISTLDCPGLTSIRRNGNSTRQIDFAIQCLFGGYEVTVADRYNGSKHADGLLFDRIVARLQNEHNLGDYLKVNRNNLTLYLMR